MRSKISYIIMLIALVTSACSTTKNLPSGEVLYTGIKEIKVVTPPDQTISDDLKSQIDGALSLAPNNSFFNSSTVRIPFPFGLWIYNNFKTEKKKGLKRWIFNNFAADPVLISDVQADIRSKAAQTILTDYGYFNGKVNYKVIPDKKNLRKAKVEYIVMTKSPYRYSSVEYINAPIPSDSIIMELSKSSLLKPGDIFNVNTLESERSRISNALRDSGFYYYRPDFISYMADSIGLNHQIALRVVPRSDLPRPMVSPWRIGAIDYSLNNSSGTTPTDTIYYNKMGIFYRRLLKVRPEILYDNTDFRIGKLYSQADGDQTQRNLGRLNMFKYSEIRYLPQDTVNDRLKVVVDATFDLPIDASFEFNVTTKSNNQTGPGAIFGLTRRNVFKGGEVFNAELTGSYEWQTGEGVKTDNGGNLINSFEFGLNTSLTYPRLLAPRFFHPDLKFPSSTSFKLNGDILNRAGFFRLLNVGGSLVYDFYTSPLSTHSFTPFSLNYSYLMSTTAQFDSIIADNRALQLSFQNQFIPSIGYTYTYDDASLTSRRNHVWLQLSVSEAGNIIYGLMDLCGVNKGKEKDLFGRNFSQFVKLRGEIRYFYELARKQILATRFIAGAIYPYLNSTEAPYSEQFFIGGSNSIRAFGVRTIGPGSYHPSSDAIYSYLDQTGTLKFEANIEYRFPIYDPLYGAVFVDAGNIWTLRKDASRPGSQLTMNTLKNDIALGTGFGLRLDITFIVIRFDIGIPLHAPYDTGKTEYYNINNFWTSLTYNLAIGYPF